MAETVIGGKTRERRYVAPGQALAAKGQRGLLTLTKLKNLPPEGASPEPPRVANDVVSK